MIIDEILDIMDDLLDNGTGVPFSVRKSIIDSDKMRECINDIRLNLPSEIKDAKNIVMDRKTIIADAKKEAEQIVNKAEVRAKTLVSNDEITKAAKTKAAEIVNQANTKAKELKNAANKYIDDILVQSEESLQGCLADIRKTRQAFKSSNTTMRR